MVCGCFLGLEFRGGGIHVGLSRVMVMVVDKFRIRVLTSLEVAITC